MHTYTLNWIHSLLHSNLEKLRIFRGSITLEQTQTEPIRSIFGILFRLLTELMDLRPKIQTQHKRTSHKKFNVEAEAARIRLQRNEPGMDSSVERSPRSQIFELAACVIRY